MKIVSRVEARGRGFWKFNVSLLQDIDYVNKVKQCIQDINANCSYMDPDMCWDFLKCQIRTVTIEYSAKVSRNRKKQENELVEKINKLETLYSVNPTEELSEEIRQCNFDLDTLYKIKTQGSIIRSRANCIEYGERNSKYFINLEKKEHET